MPATKQKENARSREQSPPPAHRQITQRNLSHNSSRRLPSQDQRRMPKSDEIRNRVDSNEDNDETFPETLQAFLPTSSLLRFKHLLLRYEEYYNNDTMAHVARDHVNELLFYINNSDTSQKTRLQVLFCCALSKQYSKIDGMLESLAREFPLSVLEDAYAVILLALILTNNSKELKRYLNDICAKPAMVELTDKTACFYHILDACLATNQLDILEDYFCRKNFPVERACKYIINSTSNHRNHNAFEWAKKILSTYPQTQKNGEDQKKLMNTYLELNEYDNIQKMVVKDNQPFKLEMILSVNAKPLKKILSILESYLDKREKTKDGSPAAEYHHFGLFKSLPNSFSLTDKRAAVNALAQILTGGICDIKPHIAALRSGELGKALRAFIKAGHLDDFLPKDPNSETPIRTVSAFLGQLDEYVVLAKFAEHGEMVEERAAMSY